eukprot:JP436386.1.p1 GENE.JP436386.1~~JP436386.1.p1  ORF type:complete len:153 (+),score=57.08 JP436386.1:65-523(+)
MSVIKLAAKDGKVFETDREVASMSETIKLMIDDCEADESVPLPNVESPILELVLAFCEKHHKFAKENASEDEISSYDKEFVRVEDPVLFNLVLAANFLDIKALLDLTCKTIADYIKACKTPEEIRRRFNIQNDFTPEEEEEVRKENSWCEER